MRLVVRLRCGISGILVEKRAEHWCSKIGEMNVFETVRTSKYITKSCEVPEGEGIHAKAKDDKIINMNRSNDGDHRP